MTHYQADKPKGRTARITWRDTWNQPHSIEVPEGEAEAKAEELRGMPDVKADTVKIEK